MLHGLPAAECILIHLLHRCVLHPAQVAVLQLAKIKRAAAFEQSDRLAQQTLADHLHVMVRLPAQISGADPQDPVCFLAERGRRKQGDGVLESRKQPAAADDQRIAENRMRGFALEHQHAVRRFAINRYIVQPFFRTDFIAGLADEQVQLTRTGVLHLRQTEGCENQQQ